MQLSTILTPQIATALRLAALEGDLLTMIAKCALDDDPNALGAIHQSGVMREVEDIANSGAQLSLLSRSIIRDIRSRLKAADKDWQLDLLAWQRVSHSVPPEGVLIVCNERDGEMVDINTARYYREKERWLETGNDHALLSKKRFGFFINPENMPPSDSSDWLVFDKLNPPAGLVLAAIESYDCGWVYQQTSPRTLAQRAGRKGGMRF